MASKVNPQHLSMSAFLRSGRPLVDHAMRTQLDGILSGGHLIIDFGTYGNVGETLRDTETKRTTHGRHGPGVKDSPEKNDLDIFAELRTWLSGPLVDEFLFRYFKISLSSPYLL
ncbi:hypothetical protein VTK26DRAFT_4011 [Humicola hyalothermophila]